MSSFFLQFRRLGASN